MFTILIHKLKIFTWVAKRLWENSYTQYLDNRTFGYRNAVFVILITEHLDNRICSVIKVNFDNRTKKCSVIKFTSITVVRLSRYYCNKQPALFLFDYLSDLEQTSNFDEQTLKKLNLTKMACLQTIHKHFTHTNAVS